MIYTVTFNPSLDYIVSVPYISYEDVNRVDSEYILPGGKGINVSLVLKALGVDNIATGFTAGFTGAQLRNILSDNGISTDFVNLSEGMTRINVKIKSKRNNQPLESEINGLGPHIDEASLAALYAKLEAISPGDYVVFAGNVQSCIQPDIYGRLTKLANNNGAQCIVDASGSLLEQALSAKPFLVKPNLIELRQLLKEDFHSQTDIICGAQKLLSYGAQNVIVSMAEQGALLATNTGNVYYGTAPKGLVRNSVGAGDSMVAGFLAAYSCGGAYEEALRMGICAGSASAFSINLATKSEILALYDDVHITMVQ